jgi:hypothetical protein
MRTSCFIAAAFLLPSLANAQAIATGTQTLRVNLAPNAKLSATPSTATLKATGGIFSNFAATVTLQYKIRTMISSGSSSLTANATGEFAPATGPRIGNGDLTLTCSGATLGTACSGAQTVSTGAQINLLTVGSGACTGSGCGGADPNSMTINLNLANSPAFKTGAYSTGLTFTISGL